MFITYKTITKRGTESKAYYNAIVVKQGQEIVVYYFIRMLPLYFYFLSLQKYNRRRRSGSWGILYLCGASPLLPLIGS